MKSKAFLLGLIGLQFTFASCEKEEPADNSSLSSLGSSSARLHPSLANANDPADERVNDNLFMLANGLASFTNESGLMSHIYVAADKPDSPHDGEVKYSELISISGDFKALMNEYLKPNYFPSEPQSFDSYQYIDDDMVYSNTDYYPALIIPNIRTCDRTKTPIVCIGAQATEDDKIIGYKRNANNTISEILISEKMRSALVNRS
jgi:hypothetical protein